MQIICPSCARKYQTEDHKNDFEIMCKCGYSILVPDENALMQEFNQAEQEKAGLEIPLDIVPNTIAEAPIQTIENANDVPNFSMEPATLDAQDEAIMISGQSLEPTPVFVEDTPTLRPQATEAKVAPPVQVLIERSIRSSLGQVLGFSYNLKISGLNSEQIQSLKMGTSEFCHFRPWLEEELKKRNILMDRMSWNDWIENLPEPLAVEIYLKTMELGGDCEFMLRT